MKHYDECYFVNYDSYEDLSLYEIGSQKCPPKYSFGPIIRENYVLPYVLEGSGTLYLNDEPFQSLVGRHLSYHQNSLLITLLMSRPHGIISGYTLMETGHLIF